MLITVRIKSKSIQSNNYRLLIARSLLLSMPIKLGSYVKKEYFTLLASHFLWLFKNNRKGCFVATSKGTKGAYLKH